MTAAIGEFLRARRARLSPGEVGLRPVPGQRRVPGLRREELAQLAGLSVDYYVQLEQGRRPHASTAVLDALARALRLTPVEREHLGTLAAAAGPARTRGGQPGQVHPARPGGPPAAAAHGPVAPGGARPPEHELQQLLDLLDRVPALVLGQRTDVVAWNAAADAVFGITSWPSAVPNAARDLFRRADARERYPGWEHLAEEVVATLHLHAGRHPGDRRLASLVGELSIASEEFRTLWARHDVRQKSSGPARLLHPVVGELVFTYRSLAAPLSPDQLLMTYVYERGSATDERLQVLLSWASPPAEDRLSRR